MKKSTKKATKKAVKKVVKTGSKSNETLSRKQFEKSVKMQLEKFLKNDSGILLIVYPDGKGFSGVSSARNIKQDVALNLVLSFAKDIAE